MSKSFIEIQHDLAEHIRNGQHNAKFEQRRLAIYQELFFNNIEGFCANAFPVLKSILEDDVWKSWVRLFLVEAQNHSPFFVDIAEQFLGFLSEKAQEQEHNSFYNKTFEPLASSPWLLELAHYEWVELHISVQEPPVLSNNCTEFLSSRAPLETFNFSLAPSAMPLAYQFPVQSISPTNYMDVTPELTTLIVHQVLAHERSEDSVDVSPNIAFVKTDVLTIHLLSFIQSVGVQSLGSDIDSDFDSESDSGNGALAGTDGGCNLDNNAMCNVVGSNKKQMVEFLTSQNFELNQEQASKYLDAALPDLVHRGVLIIE